MKSNDWKELDKLNAGLKRGGQPWRARLATAEEIRTGKNLSGDPDESPVCSVDGYSVQVVLQPVRQRTDAGAEIQRVTTEVERA